MAEADNDLVQRLKRVYTTSDEYDNNVDKWLVKEMILSIEEVDLLSMDEKGMEPVIVSAKVAGIRMDRLSGAFLM